MRQIFFTSDHHFFHKNIIRYSNRPYKDLEEMHENLIRNWNAVVQPQDLVYHLGDIALTDDIGALRDLLQTLHGDIIYINGNHERLTGAVRDRFLSRHDYLEIKVPDSDAKNGKQSITLLHYAMRVWHKAYHGAWHLYGHSHGNLPYDPDSLSFDVGVDANNYTPLSYAQVKARMAEKCFKPFGTQLP